MRAKAMSGCLSSIAGIVLIAGVAAATAAPLVPSGDLPGRERYRFTLRRSIASCSLARASSRSCAGTAARAGHRGRRDRDIAITADEHGPRLNPA
jgi:hypothetical protein